MIGLISIPGMMTGALLGGSSVEQAAKLQMVIMFMISASTALASIVATTMTLAVVVDGDHRIRSDKIDVRKHAVWRAKDLIVHKIAEGLWKWVENARRLKFRTRRREGNVDEERRRLLS